MKMELKRINSLLMAIVLFFNSSMNVAFAIDTYEYTYGSIAIVEIASKEESTDGSKSELVVSPTGTPEESGEPEVEPMETPKEEEPKVEPTETPKAEEPKVEPTETLKAEEPKVEPTETPKNEEPTESPKSEGTSEGGESGLIALSRTRNLASVSRDGRLSTRTYRNNTSRGIVSRGGERTSLSTKAVKIDGIEISEEIVAQKVEDFSNIEVVSEIEDELNGKVIGYYDLFANEYDVEEINGIISGTNIEGKEIVVVYVLAGNVYDKDYIENVEGKYTFKINEVYAYLANPAATEIEDEVITFATKEEQDNYHDKTGVNEDKIAYLNADFFSYDYEKYNEAALGREPTGGESLDNCGTILFVLQEEGKSPVGATHYGEYHATNVKNYYNYHYHGHKKNECVDVDENTEDWIDHNVLTQGLVGAPGAELTADGTPKFIFTNPGLFSKEKYSKLAKANQDKVVSVRFPFMKTTGEGYKFTSITDHVHLDETQADKRSLIFYHDENKYGEKYQQICERAMSRAGEWAYNNPCFWPFQSREKSALSIDSGTTNPFARTEGYNHFGVHLSGNFSLGKDGRVDGEEAKFSFSGDDDLWVYIDGKLALDVGGCHGVMTGEINFATGEITYGGLSCDKNKKPYVCKDKTCSGSGNKELNLVSDWGLYGDKSVNCVGMDKDDFLAKPYHKIDIFYLERAEGVANCTMSFNFKTADEIVSEKKAYVYDNDNDTREINTEDSFALPNQDIYFDLSVTNTSGVDLTDLVIYDKDLGIVMDKEGIKKVSINAGNSEGYYTKLDKLTEMETLYSWGDNDIIKIFENFKEGATVNVSEKNGINGEGTSEDKLALRRYLATKTPKFLIKDGKYKDEMDYTNTIYSIARVTLTDGSKVPTGATADVDYKVVAPKINIRQIILKGEEEPEALVKTAEINLRFNSKVATTDSEIKEVIYNTFKGYEFNKEYDILPIINSNYELVEITVDNEKEKNKDRDKDTVADSFKFNSGEYEKWITIYLTYEDDNYWHDDDEIVNKFKNIEIEGGKEQ